MFKDANDTADLQRISRIEDEGTKLTKWEEKFISSVREQLEERGSLTDRQRETVNRIFKDRVL